MNAPRLISVIMPFLNLESFIAESIESVLSQTYDHWELLLIDDGSTDGSTAIAKDYATRHPDRIRYLEHEGHANRGASASRNLGLAHARGDFIGMLDADDLWVPRKLEEQIALLDKYPQVDLLFGHTEYWYSWSGAKEDLDQDHVPWVGLESDRLYPPRSNYSLFFFNPVIRTPCTCSILVRRELIERVGGFEEQFRRVFTDQAFYAKLFLFARYYLASDVWDKYRQHPGSACQQAERAGLIHSIRLSFFKWLLTYFDSQGIGGALRRQLRWAIFAHRNPRLAHDILFPRRLARTVRSRLRTLGSRWKGSSAPAPALMRGRK